MQGINSKIKPIPSKLYAYQLLYEDIGNFKTKYDKFSITEFGCGGSKILNFFSPFFYQGIDLNKEKILISQKKYSDSNYKFYVGDMINFDTEIKTDLGLCFQTLGINLSFDKQNLLSCMENLNNHVKQDGSILFNISLKLYLTHKHELDEFFEKNFLNVEYVFYGLFNSRYNNLLTRALVRVEHLFSSKNYFKSFLYIRCIKKRHD